MEQTKAPKRIWLQDGCDEEDCIDCEHLSEYEGVTWCGDPIHDNDTEYVRVDLFEAAETERDRLAAALENTREVLRNVAYIRGGRRCWCPEGHVGGHDGPCRAAYRAIHPQQEPSEPREIHDALDLARSLYPEPSDER